jgi:hypothetical protein
VSQKSAANSPVSNMDLSQTSRHNSPSNCSAFSASKSCDEKTINLHEIKLEPTDFNIKVENVDPLAIKFEPAPRDVDFSCSENLHTQNLEPPAIKCEADVDLTDSEQWTSELMIKDEHVEDEQDMQGE